MGPGCAAAPAPSSAPCDLPVAAPVSDGFRPPPEPWLPGNRGLTFATGPAEPVRAVRPGLVGFAGRIAQQWYVTVVDADSTDTTYSFLSSVTVTTGDRVVVGEVVGLTGRVPFQLGLRDDGRYVDPTDLVTRACGWDHAVLVPVPE